MKNFIFVLFTFVSSLFLTSCLGTIAETYVEEPDVQLIVRYGTPYYYNSSLLYYYYGGHYFYPYRYGNVWRFHRYSRPLPPPHPRPQHFNPRPPVRPNVAPTPPRNGNDVMPQQNVRPNIGVGGNQIGNIGQPSRSVGRTQTRPSSTRIVGGGTPQRGGVRR